ncbi:unnamed protein product, partial [Anisakis simplex]|uniref:Abdominal-B n=1 Tax=Anisakis simplex TaxID=6269 RepID=A0A0M3J3N5_ANISI
RTPHKSTAIVPAYHTSPYQAFWPRQVHQQQQQQQQYYHQYQQYQYHQNHYNPAPCTGTTGNTIGPPAHYPALSAGYHGYYQQHYQQRYPLKRMHSGSSFCADTLATAATLAAMNAFPVVNQSQSPKFISDHHKYVPASERISGFEPEQWNKVNTFRL